LRGKPWKVKGGTTMIHSKSWSMWNAKPGIWIVGDMVNFTGTIPKKN
jgi:hypothetical protein